MNEFTGEFGEVTVHPGDVLLGQTEHAPLVGLHRVLEVNRRAGLVTLVPIQITPRKTTGKKQANYYAKGFFQKKLEEIRKWLREKIIVKTSIDLPSHFLLSDEAINRGAHSGRISKDSQQAECKSPLLIKRDFKWQLISPLIPESGESGRLRPPNLLCLDKLVRERAAQAGVSKGQVYDALHRYYAFGCIKNALLPNTINRSGAPGKPRIAKNGVKLGRKNASVKMGDSGSAGLILSEDDKQNLKDGYRLFVRPGTTVRQAYLSMSSTFYSTGHSIKHGHIVPILLDANQRPTESEFRHHGPKADEVTAVARRLMGEGEWMRDYRPLVGTARDGIFTMGQVGSLDASPIDVNCVSCIDPLQSIGVGRGLFVRDAYSGLFYGWHIGIGNLGTEDAKLAILRAATNKAATLKRYNLDLPTDDFPFLFFSKYISDNGELRSIDGIESIVGFLNSRIEFVASGRADRNSPSEAGHHTRHRGLDHHLTGTTKGRQRKRGETSPIELALLSRYEYVRLLLKWMHWANTKQQLPLHSLSAEMLRDFSREGKIPERTRIESYRWARRNGYIAGKPVDENYLRSQLLPRFTATVQRSGLVLHRPNTGDSVELLHGARFNHEYLAQSGLIQEALRTGRIHIEVRADPDDLSSVIVVDKNGIHTIPNIKDDVILKVEGSIPDLCAINDMEKVRNIETASKRDQDELDQQSFRLEVEADAKQRKRQAKAQHKDKPLPVQNAVTVRAAQKIEERAQLDGEIRRASQSTESAPAAMEKKSSAETPAASSMLSTPEGVSTSVIDLMKSRLSRFNAERKH